MARVAAALSPTLKDPAGRPLGLLGWFEAQDQPDAVAALLAAAAGRLRAAGAGAVAGPIDGDTWHRYRVNLGPFDEPPFAMEPWNPPYHGALWLRAGFSDLAGYYSTRLDDLPGAIGALAPRAARAAAAGYTMRPLEAGRFPEELDLLFDLSRRIFAGNFLYSEIPRGSFHALYEGIERRLDPRLVWIARSRDGAPAGFAFAFPEPGAPGTLNLKTVGILPEHRRFGLASALARRVYGEAAPKGFSAANLCLIEGKNPSGTLDGGLGRVFRRYALYAEGWEGKA